MSRKRTTLEPEEVATREQAEQLLKEIAQSANRIQHLEAQLENQLQETRRRYEGAFDHEKAIIKTGVKLLKVWAEANRDAFGRAKSLNMLHGSIGWRKTTPKVALVKGRAMEAVVSLVKGVKRAWIRSKPELDKERILADYNAEKTTDDQLERLGLKITQQNRFFADPKVVEVNL